MWRLKRAERAVDWLLLLVLAALAASAFYAPQYADYLWALSLSLSVFDLVISRESSDVVVTLLLTAPMVLPQYTTYIYLAALAAQLGDVVAG